MVYCSSVHLVWSWEINNIFLSNSIDRIWVLFVFTTWEMIFCFLKKSTWWVGNTFSSSSFYIYFMTRDLTSIPWTSFSLFFLFFLIRILGFKYSSIWTSNRLNYYSINFEPVINFISSLMFQLGYFLSWHRNKLRSWFRCDANEVVLTF